MAELRRLFCSGKVNWKRLAAAWMELFDKTRSSIGLPNTLLADLGVVGVWGVLGDCGSDSGESGRIASKLGMSFFFDLPSPTLLAKMEVRDLGLFPVGAVCCGSVFLGGGWGSILLMETSLVLRSLSRRDTDPANECLKLRMLPNVKYAKLSGVSSSCCFFVRTVIVLLAHFQR